MLLDYKHSKQLDKTINVLNPLRYIYFDSFGLNSADYLHYFITLLDYSQF